MLKCYAMLVDDPTLKVEGTNTNPPQPVNQSHMNFAISIFTAAATLIGPSLSNAQAEKTAKPESAVASDLARRVDLLERRVNNLNSRVTYKFAVLDCNTGKFDEFLLTTSVLPFFASCSKIEPYLEGHRLTISVGNPHSFNFSQVKGTLNYGKDYADSISKHVEVAPMEQFRSGSWTTISVIVNPSRPEDMRYISLELGAPTVSQGR